MNIDDVCSLPAVSTYLLLEVFFWCLGILCSSACRSVPLFFFRHTHKKTRWSTYVFLPALKLPGDSSEARFPLGKETRSGRAGSITCEFTLTCEPKTHCTWENTMKVNLRNVAGFLQRAFSLKKTRNVGAIGRESYKFTITFNARRVLREKTHGIWKGFCYARFSWKKIRNPGAVGRGSYEFTVTRNARRILPEKQVGKHVNYHVICWVGVGGMLTFLALAHMLDATQDAGLGWGGC